jgi:hypothetical protein
LRAWDSNNGVHYVLDYGASGEGYWGEVEDWPHKEKDLNAVVHALAETQGDVEVHMEAVEGQLKQKTRRLTPEEVKKVQGMLNESGLQRIRIVQ